MHRIETKFTKSSGAGGQNVNKVNSKVEMRFRVDDAEWIPGDARERLAILYRSRINKDGFLVIESQRHRGQHQNRTDCEGKLRQMIQEALVVPKVRNMRVGPTKQTKAKNRHDKRKRSQVKSARRVDKRDF